jgi:hypothetical protein
MVLVAVDVLFSFTPMERATATANTGSVWDVVGFARWPQGRLSVWVYTPHLAPGDKVSRRKTLGRCGRPATVPSARNGRRKNVVPAMPIRQA